MSKIDRTSGKKPYRRNAKSPKNSTLNFSVKKASKTNVSSLGVDESGSGSVTPAIKTSAGMINI